MLRLVVIADDLTGALDTGIKFIQQGVKTQVIGNLDFSLEDIEEDTQVLSVDTETRHVPADEAYKTIYSLVIRFMAMGVPYFYKKTDSALRGHIGSELGALHQALGVPVHFVPALPQENRGSRNGIQYINGIPVSESIFGQDPINPVRHSSIKEIIEEELSLNVLSIPTPQESKEMKAGSPHREKRGDIKGGSLSPFCFPEDEENRKDSNLYPDILVYDGETEADLESIARLLGKNSKIKAIAGCAGMAHYLPDLLSLDRIGLSPYKKGKRFFIVSGSLNSITGKQLKYASDQNGYARIQLNSDQKLMPNYFETDEGHLLLQKLKAEADSGKHIIVDVYQDKKEGETLKKAAKYGIPIQNVPICISERLSEIAQLLTEGQEDSVLFIIGGDTLHAFIRRLGFPPLNPLRELIPGTVLMNLNQGNYSLSLISKSGGFGKEDIIIELETMMIEDEMNRSEL